METLPDHSQLAAYSLIESIFGIIGYMTKLFLQHHHLHV